MSADYYDQTAYTAGKTVGNPLLAVRKDTPADIASANADTALLQLDSAGSLRVTEDGGIPTYAASLTALALPASATDVVVLSNSTTKVLRVTRVRYTITAAAAATSVLQVSKLSTLPSGGGATTAVAVPLSSANGTATATVLGYLTLAATLGSHVGALRSDRMLIPVTSTGVSNTIVEHDFRGRGNQGLRIGVSEGICINFGTATSLTTGLMDCTIEWCECPLTA